MFKKKLNLFKDRKILTILIINLLLRIPGYFSGIDPHVFIDEFILWVEFERLLLEKTFLIEKFRFGGPLNYYFVFAILLPVNILANIFGTSLTLSTVLIFSRAVLNIVASSLAIVYLIKINNLVNENKSVYSNYVLAFLFMLNPYFYGQVRIWYPDSYLYIFTILATYFLILIYKEINYSNNVYFLFFILALGTSIKLTFFYFGIIIFIFFIYELFFNKRNIFWLLVKGFLLYLFIFIPLNFSSFINSQDFLKDLVFMHEHYGVREISNLSNAFPYHVLFLFVVPSTIFGLLYVINYLRYLIRNKSLFMLTLFFIYPVFYIFIFSFYPIFLNRTINLFVPYIIFSLATGIDRIFFQERKHVNYLQKINMFLFLSIYLFSFTLTFIDDLKTDSRLEADHWLKENTEILNTKVGVNSYTILENYSFSVISEEIVIDKEVKLNLEYYIIDEFSKNELIETTYPNPIFILNHKDDHIKYFSNSNFFNFILSSQKKFKQEDNYILLKEFVGNGPNVYIFKKN